MTIVRATVMMAVAAAAACSSVPGTECSIHSDTQAYLLGPGDQLRITVFRHEDLSGEYTIDGEGNLSLPLGGEIRGGGRTARQVETEIEDVLRSNDYLIDPQASIEVLTYRPFYIIGEVNKPGSFPFVNGMTVINAVALAGGFSYRADEDGIILERAGAKCRARLDSQLLPGDIVEVTERFF